MFGVQGGEEDSKVICIKEQSTFGRRGKCGMGGEGG